MYYLLQYMLLLVFIVNSTQSPVLFVLSVFLVHPVSTAAVDGSTVEFTCTANTTDSTVYRVNGSSASLSSISSKGFIQLSIEVLDTLVFRRNLSATVSSQYNNTEIYCIAIGSPNVDSDTALLTVQGPLSSVVDLSHSFVDSSTVNISWSPPFTLPGADITGYNISVTSNGTNTTTNYFTSDSHYVLLLTDITDSPCNEIIITVSGYNGLNGETDSLSGIYLSTPGIVPYSVSISNMITTTSIVLHLNTPENMKADDQSSNSLYFGLGFMSGVLSTIILVICTVVFIAIVCYCTVVRSKTNSPPAAADDHSVVPAAANEMMLTNINPSYGYITTPNYDYVKQQ